MTIPILPTVLPPAPRFITTIFVETIETALVLSFMLSIASISFLIWIRASAEVAQF